MNVGALDSNIREYFWMIEGDEIKSELEPTVNWRFETPEISVLEYIPNRERSESPKKSSARSKRSASAKPKVDSSSVSMRHTTSKITSRTAGTTGLAGTLPADWHLINNPDYFRVALNELAEANGVTPTAMKRIHQMIQFMYQMYFAEAIIVDQCKIPFNAQMIQHLLARTDVTKHIHGAIGNKLTEGNLAYMVRSFIGMSILAISRSENFGHSFI